MDRRDEIIEELQVLVAKLTAQVEAQAKRIGERELALARRRRTRQLRTSPRRATLSIRRLRNRRVSRGNPSEVVNLAIDSKQLCPLYSHLSRST